MVAARSLFRIGWMLGVGACFMPTCAPHPTAPAPHADEPATRGATATAPAAPPQPKLDGGVGRWPTNDVSAPDPGFPPVERLDLSLALWGQDIPNLLKSVTVAWDGVGQRLYAMGIATDRLMVIDPKVGHPVGAIDLDIRGHNTALLRVDEKRRRLYWISKADGSIRAVDLDKGELVARSEGVRTERPGEEHRGYPIHGATIDPATGWVWVANLVGHTLTGTSPDLKQTKVATGIEGPGSVDAAPGGDDLLVVDAPERDSMRLVRYKPSTDTIVSSSTVPRAAGPNAASFAPDGTIIQAGRMLVALGADGAPRWKVPLGAQPEAVAYQGDTIAVILGDPADSAAPPPGEGEGNRPGGPRRPGRAGRPPDGERPAPPSRPVSAPVVADTAPERRVLFFDLATGAARGEVTASFEAKSLAVDAAGGRLFVANGGDGSVSVVDLATKTVTSTIDAGNSAEEVVVDPKSGDRYILNRLGGSVVYRWPKDATTVEAWPAGKWPSDLAIDPERRRLWALGHYEATIEGWDLDTHAHLPPIALGLPANHSDTLGDLDYDATVGLAAVVFSESGGLAVVDPMAGKVLWSKTESALAAGPKAGPGNAFVAVDGKRNRLYVAADRGKSVLAYELRTGKPVGSLSLTPPDDAHGESYNINGAWLDRKGGRLFVGPQVVKVPDLAAVGRLDGVGKIFWSDEHALLALGAGSDSAPERLLELDPTTFSLRKTWPLVRTGMMRLCPTYDPATHRVYVADMAEARVLAWEWPPR